MVATQNLLPVYQTFDLPLKSMLNEIHENRWVLPARLQLLRKVEGKFDWWQARCTSYDHELD